MSDTDNGAALAAPDAGTVDSATPSNEVDPWEAIESTMDKTWDKLNPERTDTGQFKGDEKPAPAEGDKPETKSTEASPVVASTEPPPAAIVAPQSLPAELKADLEKAPPAIQQWIAKREAESHQRISELGQTVKATEAIRGVIDHYKADCQTRNLQPHQAVEMLFEAQRELANNWPRAIEKLAELFGQPSPFAGSQTAEPGSESAEVRSLKATVARLEQDVGKTREHVMAEQRSKQDREAANLASLVDEFSKDKTDFSEIESDVVAQIHAIRNAEPGLDTKALLAKAYENARWANPNTRAKMQEAQRKDEETKRTEDNRKKAEEAKRASKLNVKSSNGASPARKGSWEQTMEAAADAAYNR